jgi:hypothetical protein
MAAVAISSTDWPATMIDSGWAGRGSRVRREQNSAKSVFGGSPVVLRRHAGKLRSHEEGLIGAYSARTFKVSGNLKVE